jgi:hypothetical protein
MIFFAYAGLTWNDTIKIIKARKNRFLFIVLLDVGLLYLKTKKIPSRVYLRKKRAVGTKNEVAFEKKRSYDRKLEWHALNIFKWKNYCQTRFSDSRRHSNVNKSTTSPNPHNRLT